MKVLYVASEASPYVQSGGLGEVIGALPKAISVADSGIEAEVIIPLYSAIPEEYRKNFIKVTDISFKLAWRELGATVYKSKQGKVNYYFIENHYYFDRNGLYGEYDDAERFAFFSMAVIEFIRKTGNYPNILHANDWQAALAVIYLKTIYRGNKELSAIRTLYTIHNIEYQGKYDLAILGDVLSLDDQARNVVEYKGCINLMKGAITVSDYISTVSPNYRNELRHDFFAYGLANVIRGAEHKFAGVINGIDYSYYSPEVGGDIYVPYSKRGYKSGKSKNKAAFQKEIGLVVAPKTPLAVMITRLTEGKGIDLVLHIIDELLSENIQLAVLGTGDKKYEEAFLALAEKHSNFKAIMKFDRAASKKMYAAADMFIMPSKSEPCGLAQMIAASYGAVPIVRAVGGLYDTIRAYGAENSNGFVFENYNAHELLYTVKAALSLYRDDEKWAQLVKRTLNSNFSWSNSAEKYISLYNNLLNW